MILFFFLSDPPPPRSTRNAHLVPYPTRFRSQRGERPRRWAALVGLVTQPASRTQVADPLGRSHPDPSRASAEGTIWRKPIWCGGPGRSAEPGGLQGREIGRAHV